MTDSSAEQVAMDDARAAWRNADVPELCPRCGSWGGPRLPFCTDGGHWTHDNTCAVYKFANEVCDSCAEAVYPPGSEV